MLSGIVDGERHQTFTESYFCAIDLLIRPIRSESDCELAVSDTVIANIIEIIRFICKYNFTKFGRKNQTQTLSVNKVSTMGFSLFFACSL